MQFSGYKVTIIEFQSCNIIISISKATNKKMKFRKCNLQITIQKVTLQNSNNITTNLQCLI